MSRQVLYRGKKFQLALDRSTLPDGTVLEREVIQHPGAVVMIPLLDRDLPQRVPASRDRYAQPEHQPALAAFRRSNEEAQPLRNNPRHRVARLGKDLAGQFRRRHDALPGR